MKRTTHTNLVTKVFVKEELRSLESRIKADMVTQEERIRDDMSYKITSLETRLRQDMATKTDLETAVAQIIEAIDQNVAPKKDVEQLKKRVKRVEDHLNLA